jgi:hypothetical protein
MYPDPMNATLRALIDDAEARLSAADRERLADLVGAYVETHAAGSFTPEERAHLETLDREPFDPAPPETVAALFARRG